jgi:hypothetical protein
MIIGITGSRCVSSANYDIIADGIIEIFSEHEPNDVHLFAILKAGR